MSDNNTTSKAKILKAFKIIVYIFVALLLILGVLYVLNTCFDNGKFDYQEKDEDIFYFSADYDENISDDIVYMSFDRNIRYTDVSGFSRVLNGENVKGNLVAELMYNYFTALFNGDVDLHESLFTEHYKENIKIQTKFTPQKIYDIDICYLTGSDGKDMYKVVYKIYENNGSYRADIGSNVAKVMAFEIAKTGEGVLINSIGYISDK